MSTKFISAKSGRKEIFINPLNVSYVEIWKTQDDTTCVNVVFVGDTAVLFTGSETEKILKLLGIKE